jgi:hypothetical protein
MPQFEATCGQAHRAFRLLLVIVGRFQQIVHALFCPFNLEGLSVPGAESAQPGSESFQFLE